ncbi:TetR/AcrR family transcriptional regulator [Kineococcus sp. SYSU DK002]|uniref:TetR/AcrR family transcriptional regulator n=1 Tax=Kineococcus sp. SYSU DK002 TaxID=3383123 RepID=UPI003D7D3729
MGEKQTGDRPVRQTHRSARERREQLLDAAVEVVSGRGVKGLTTRAVTEQAGVPHGVFHYTFGSKQELFSALLEREVSSTLASVADAMRACSDVATALQAALTAQLHLVQRNPDYHLALNELSLAHQRVDAAASLSEWEQRQYRARTCADLQAWSLERGLTWTVDLEDLAAYLVALGAGVATTWLADRDDRSARSAIAVAAQAVSALAVVGAHRDGRPATAGS